MNRSDGLEKPRIPKRFYFISALIYLPVLYGLTIIHARWFGFVLAGFSFVMLLWMRSRPLWSGLRVPFCFALAFTIALSGLYLSRPDREVSLRGQIGRESVRFFLSLPIDEDIRTGERFEKVSVWKVPKGYLLQNVKLPHCSSEVLRREESQSTHAVLQLHGGAFISGMIDVYRVMAVRYCDYIEGGTVLTVDYRLWPGYGYPIQQQDAMSAWRYLVDELGFDPQNIIVAGDSAGGNLALQLGLALRDAGEALPGGIICMSPWADLSNSGPSHITNAMVDPTFGVEEDQFTGAPVGVPTSYADELDPKDPYVSPSFGDYSGFPPMLLQVGGDEVLLSDSEMVYQNALAHGVDCTLTVYSGMFHVFQGSFGVMPESIQAWKEIEDFIRKRMIISNGEKEG